MKNIILCFDGTSNTPSSQTNIRKIHTALGKSNKTQIRAYIEGVGTGGFIDKLIGGIFGNGISLKIINGYKRILDHYVPGDKIFLIGYSRGALKARSLAAMINSIGIVSKEKWKANGGKWNTEKIATAAWKVYVESRETNIKKTHLANTFKSKNSYPKAEIEMLGLFDTVAACAFQEITSYDLKHKTIIKNAFHAVAIDEKRKAFNVTLLKRNSKSTKENIVKEVWFVGSHANIGGGKEDKGLADIPLDWMVKKMIDLGVSISPKHLKKITPNILGEIIPSEEQISGISGTISRTIPPRALIHTSVRTRLKSKKVATQTSYINKPSHKFVK